MSTYYKVTFVTRDYSISVNVGPVEVGEVDGKDEHYRAIELASRFVKESAGIELKETTLFHVDVDEWEDDL